MKKPTAPKKVLIIFLIILILIPVSIKAAPAAISAALSKYDEYYKKKYYKDFPNNKTTLYLQDTLDGITVIDHIYSEEYGTWFLYVQSDTSEKTEEILEKAPELIAYGRNNFKGFSKIDIYCQIDFLTDHFASCLPYVYMFIIENTDEINYDITLCIAPNTIERENMVQRIFENGSFPKISAIESDMELSSEILESFPDLEKYLIDSPAGTGKYIYRNE